MLRGMGVIVLLACCFVGTDAFAQSSPLREVAASGMQVSGSKQTKEAAAQTAAESSGILKLQSGGSTLLAFDEPDQSGSEPASTLLPFGDEIAIREATRVYYRDVPVSLGVSRNPPPLLAAYEFGILGEQSVVATAKLEVSNLNPGSTGPRTVYCNLDIPGYGLLDWNSVSVAPGEAASMSLSTLAPMATSSGRMTGVYLRCFARDRAPGSVEVNYAKMIVHYGAQDVRLIPQ